MEKSSIIRLIKPNISPAEIEAVNQVLNSGMLVNGPMVRRFESLLAKFLGVANAVCVSSGTAALHLSLLAGNIRPGDEVIVSAFTFPATANVVEIAGAVPVFVDNRPGDVNIDPDKIPGKISVRTKAIIPVHAFGLPAEMETVLSIAAKYNLTVIEDAACALGSKYNERACGSLGDLAAFSFHPRKLLTTGEGGAVVTDDGILADMIRSLRNHGYDQGDYGNVGLNYRMTDFQAALGISQLERYPQMLENRKRLADKYSDIISDIKWLKPLSTEPHIDWNRQTYIVIVDEEINRDSLIKHLADNDVEATIGTYCVPLTKYYRLRYGFTADEFPAAFDMYKRSLSLPLFDDMSGSQLSHIYFALKKFKNHKQEVMA